jgi:hypothetical protein
MMTFEEYTCHIGWSLALACKARGTSFGAA